MFDQVTPVQNQRNDVAQIQPHRLLAHYIQLGHKAADGSPGAARHGTHRVVQGAALAARQVLQLLHAARTNATGWKVHYAHETGVVVGVLQQAQIRQRMLDFSSLKEAQAAVYTVGHTGIEKRRLDHPALGVAAVQDSDFFSFNIVAHQLLHLVHHPLGFQEVARRLVNTHGLARALGRAQVLAQPLAVVADQRISTIQNVAVRAVVLLQLDLVLHIKLAHKVGHIAHTRAAKGVNALVIVAHRQHRTTWGVRAGHAVPRIALPRQHLDPGVLQLVGVLKLVNQDVAKTALVVLAHGVVVA